MRWAEAVKIWNTHKKSVNASHVYCLPRKGTPEHAHVKHIQAGGAPDKFEHAAAPKAPAEKMEAPKKFVFKKKAEKEADKKLKEDVEVMGEKAKRKKVRAFLMAALERRRSKKEAAKADKKASRPQKLLETLKSIRDNKSLESSSLPSKRDRFVKDIYEIVSYQVQSDDYEDDKKFYDEYLDPLFEKYKIYRDEYNVLNKHYVRGSDIDAFIKSLERSRGSA